MSKFETRIDEIGDNLYRIHTAVPPSVVPGGFSFNQFLVVDDAPLLFHTGGRALFDSVQQAISRIIPVTALRYVAFSHYEDDECGAMDAFLAAAPQAAPVCSSVGAMINGGGFGRPAHTLADGASLSLGKRTLRWYDTPHLPHGWDCGYLFDETFGTLFCGDLFTQPGADTPALTSGDILGPSEAMRTGLDYYAHGPSTRAHLSRLAALKPKTLACMHGSAWSGDGAALLGALADALAR
jgi:flavorubredoxin